jgi:two-component system, chemotaxis family, response regulator Rcp1
MVRKSLMSLYQRRRPAEILLVEDSLADIRLFIEALKQCSIPHHLTAIDNGQEALAFLRRNGSAGTAPQPDLVVLDLNLPGLNGHEVLTAIRADSALRHLPVIILTSSTAPQDVYELYRISANCFITKPLDIDQFFFVVRTMIEFWLGVATIPDGTL